MNNLSEKVLFQYIIKFKKSFLKYIPNDFFSDSHANKVMKEIKSKFLTDSKILTKSTLLLLFEKDGDTLSMVEYLFEEIDLLEYDFDELNRIIKNKIIKSQAQTNIVNLVETFKNLDFDKNAEDDASLLKDIAHDSFRFNFDQSSGINPFDSDDINVEDLKKYPHKSKFINDSLSGGLSQGSLTCYLGNSGIGKTWFLANDAAHFVQKGFNTIFITCEMSEYEITKRITSQMYSIPINSFDEVAKDKKKLKSKISTYKDNYLFNDNYFRIKQLPMQATTANDIHTYITQIEQEQEKDVDVIIIDYLNVLSAYNIKTSSENTYQMLRFVSMDLKELSQRKNCIIITACQTNRAAYGRDTVSLDNIADSAAIIHNSDNIFGIFRDDEMEQNMQYGLKLLKTRNGDQKDSILAINIDPLTMKLNYLK